MMTNQHDAESSDLASAKLDAKTPTLTPLQPAKSFFRYSMAFLARTRDNVDKGRNILNLEIAI